MSIFEYDEEAVFEIVRKDEYEKGLQEGLEKGIEKGIEEGKERVFQPERQMLS